MRVVIMADIGFGYVRGLREPRVSVHASSGEVFFARVLQNTHCAHLGLVFEGAKQKHYCAPRKGDNCLHLYSATGCELGAPRTKPNLQLGV